MWWFLYTKSLYQNSLSLTISSNEYEIFTAFSCKTNNILNKYDTTSFLAFTHSLSSYNYYILWLPMIDHKGHAPKCEAFRWMYITRSNDIAISLYNSPRNCNLQYWLNMLSNKNCHQNVIRLCTNMTEIPFIPLLFDFYKHYPVRWVKGDFPVVYNSNSRKIATVKILLWKI